MLASLDPTLPGETTTVLLIVDGNRLYGASVGDSEAWMLGTANLRLTASQQRKPLLGSGAASPVPFSAVLDGVLLLASDGLFKYTTRRSH